MKISENGVKKIVGYENKLRSLGDGRYAAYLCPAGVWTIFAGCTAGVKEGMIVTEAEGEAMFAIELRKCESAVLKLVTVDLNQNEFDALVSFVYNCGPGALQKSTLLKRLNKGDRKGAAAAFGFFNKARKNGKGPLVEMRGLTSRRASEASLFLKPVEAPAEPIMPQAVGETAPVSKPAVAVGAAAIATAAPAVVPLPAVPDVITQSVTQLEAWKSAGVAVWTLKAWAMAEPILASGLAVSMGGFYYWSKKQQGAK